MNVFTDVDGEDWQRPGVDAVVRNATPRDGAGATVLLHDAGGDRSQTVAALDRLIPELQARGYRFTTATDAVGAPAAAAPAPTRDRAVGGALVTAVDLATGDVRVLQGLLVGVGLDRRRAPAAHAPRRPPPRPTSSGPVLRLVGPRPTSGPRSR